MRCGDHPAVSRRPRSGGLDGQLGGADGDQEALVLLIRGVGSHLDVPARETRLSGMRVGEAVAELGGQSLRFDELDGEREERRRRRRQERDAAPAAEKPEKGNGEDANGVGETGAGTGMAAAAAAAMAAEEGADGSAEKRENGDGGARRNKPRKRKGSKGRKRDKGSAVRDSAEEEKRRRMQSLPAGWGGGDNSDSDLDPDMLLPLGGEESGSDSDAENMVRSLLSAMALPVLLGLLFVCVFLGKKKKPTQPITRLRQHRTAPSTLSVLDRGRRPRQQRQQRLFLHRGIFVGRRRAAATGRRRVRQRRPWSRWCRPRRVQRGRRRGRRRR